MKLLELVIALALSAMLYLIVDTIYSGLWLTRTNIHHAQDALRLRQLPEQLLGKLLLHAGHLGCRAVRDGIVIKAPSQVPAEFFIQQGQAVQIHPNEIWIHETLSHQMLLTHALEPNSQLMPVGLEQHSDWLLISDCLSAELVPYGGAVTQSYQTPVYVAPVIVTRWYVKGSTLYRQQVYPWQAGQPVVDGVKKWQWKRDGSLMHLLWETQDADAFIFELGNS